MFINRTTSEGGMAKAGSTFFLRARLSMPADGAFTEQEIPLGAFLNPLADQALVIHNIEVQLADTDNPEAGPYKTGSIFNFGWNLCTSPIQTAAAFDTTYLDDNSVVASGRYNNLVGAADEYFEATTKDMMPQSWTAGYTVASESLFLSGQSPETATAGTYELSVVMECSQLKLGKNEAINLALSQTN
jgi:hypothetical protein